MPGSQGFSWKTCYVLKIPKLWGSGVTSDLEFETTLGTTKQNNILEKNYQSSRVHQNQRWGCNLGSIPNLAKAPKVFQH